MDYQGLKESNASFNGSTPVLIISGAGADLGLTEEVGLDPSPPGPSAAPL